MRPRCTSFPDLIVTGKPRVVTGEPEAIRLASFSPVLDLNFSVHFSKSYLSQRLNPTGVPAKRKICSTMLFKSYFSTNLAELARQLEKSAGVKVLAVNGP